MNLIVKYDIDRVEPMNQKEYTNVIVIQDGYTTVGVTFIQYCFVLCIFSTDNIPLVTYL